MVKSSNREEAASLIKGGTGAITGGILALLQQGLGDSVAVFELGIFSGIVPTFIDHFERSLSGNERRRVEDVTRYTLREIERHLNEGHEPRTDGFLNITPEVRSSAQELCEGILESSRAEHQEAKLPYVGCFYASVLFTNNVSSNEAERMFRILKSLTYSEMCILALLSGPAGSDGLRTNCIDKEEGSDEFVSLIQECFELEGWGLLSQVNNDQAPHFGAPSCIHVVPANLRVTTYGMRFIELARLSEIQEKDTAAVREIMR